MTIGGELDYDAMAWLLVYCPTLEPPIVTDNGDGTYTHTFSAETPASNQERIQQAVERVLRSKGSLLPRD